MRGSGFALVAALATAGAAGAEVRLPASLAAMSAEQFQSRAEIDADPLEFETEISTHPAHRSGRAAGTVRSDAWLVAVIDRRSGAVRYELRKDIRYAGPRRDFRTVQFLDAGTLQSAPLTLARHGPDLCPNSDFNGDCYLSKTLAFAVPEPMLRRIAALPEPAWAFKLKDARGKDVTGALVPAEAEGLLRAVAQYRAGLRIAAR